MNSSDSIIVKYLLYYFVVDEGDGSVSCVWVAFPWLWVRTLTCVTRELHQWLLVSLQAWITWTWVSHITV